MAQARFKTQITVKYEGFKPIKIDTVVLSHQHYPDVQYDELKDTLINRVIKPVLGPTGLLADDTKYFINPTGRFVIGGPLETQVLPEEK